MTARLKCRAGAQLTSFYKTNKAIASQITMIDAITDDDKDDDTTPAAGVTAAAVAALMFAHVVV